MSFRSVCLLIAFASLAAGVFMGWLDFENERRVAPRSVPSSPRGGAEAKELGTPPPERAESREKDGAAPERWELTRAEEATLAKIAARLRAHEFAEAAAEAGRLARASRGLLRARAERLEARAFVFDRLVPRSRVRHVTAQEVVLRNGHRLQALEVTKEAAGYRVRQPGGITMVLRDADVAEVRDVDSEAFLADLRKRMVPRVERFDHPIDLYVRGIRRLYDSGLEDDGLRFMEKLLDLPQSDQIPLLFGGEEAELLLQRWELARREPVAPTVATAASPGAPSSGPRGPRGPPETVESKPPAVADAGVLDRVRALVAQARRLQSGAITKGDGREAEHVKAYERLREAQSLLQTQPRNKDVRRLTSSIGQLISDVQKSLPF